MLLTDQETEAVTEDSTDNMSVEQVHECLAEVLPQTESAHEPLSEELKEPTVEVSDLTEPTKEVPDTVESSTEQLDLYAQRCKEYQREQEQKRQNTIGAIMEYVTHTMSPYIYDNEELEKLCDAIRKWADDWQHIPVPIRLKSTLTTLDLRHFVWNIAERLGGLLVSGPKPRSHIRMRSSVSIECFRLHCEVSACRFIFRRFSGI
jgi:hypothetical protein